MKTSFFKQVNQMEDQDNLIDAINISKQMLTNRDLIGLHNIIKSNINRIIRKLEARVSNYWKDPEIIYQISKNPYSYCSDTSNIANDDLPPIISLTTISSRLDRVKHTIKSIQNQTLKIHSINLYISESPYLLDKGIDKNCNELIELHKMGVNIYSVPNIGPYRKQIPIIYQLKNSAASPYTPIITIDDDVIYPNDIVNKLINIKDWVVVAHRGREMILDNTKIGDYNKFSLAKTKRSYLHLGTGKNGILYRLGFFPNNKEAYVGPLIAPTADDLWCKWITAFSCIPTEILEPEAAFNAKLDFQESDPTDKNGLFHQFNKKGSNDIAIKNLENYYFCKFNQNLFTIFSFTERS